MKRGVMKRIIPFILIFLLLGCRTYSTYVVEVECHPSIGGFWSAGENEIAREFVQTDNGKELFGAPMTERIWIRKRVSQLSTQDVLTTSLTYEIRGQVIEVKDFLIDKSALPEQKVKEDVFTGSIPGFPESYNVCDNHWCPPVRDQARCGSCWAFATTGVTEAAIYNALVGQFGTTQAFMDAAEQFLVSCNTKNWGCHGGHWAYMFWEDLPVAEEEPVGLVPEWDFPYKAQELPCELPYQHEHALSGWHYILGCDINLTPTVNQVKQAILDYGVVGTAMCVNSAFVDYPYHYKDDVFIGPYCYNSNHVVLILGWDDNKGGGSWLIQNSWGENWGNSGRVWIPYGKADTQYCSTVAYYEPDFDPVSWLPMVLKKWKSELPHEIPAFESPLELPFDSVIPAPTLDVSKKSEWVVIVGGFTSYEEAQEWASHVRYGAVQRIR